MRGKQVHTPGRRPPPAPSSRCGRPRRRGRPAPGPAPPRRHPLRPLLRRGPGRPGVERGHALPGEWGQGARRSRGSPAAGGPPPPPAAAASRMLASSSWLAPATPPSAPAPPAPRPPPLARPRSGGWCCWRSGSAGRCPRTAPPSGRPCWLPGGHAGQATDRLLTVHLVPFPLAPGCRAGRPYCITPTWTPRKRAGPARGPRGPPASAPLAAVGRPHTRHSRPTASRSPQNWGVIPV